MAIVKMKKLRLLAVRSQCSDIIRELMLLGCVEVSEPDESTAEEMPWLGRYSSEELSRLRDEQRTISNALDILGSYVPAKKGMLKPKKEISCAELLDESTLPERLELADCIVIAEDQIRRWTAEEGKLKASIEMLTPWKNMDVDLDCIQTKTCSVTAGMLPIAVEERAVENAVSDAAEEAQLFWIGGDREQRYLLVVCHESAKSEVFEQLRIFGFAPAQFGELRGSARSNIAQMNRKLSGLAEKKAGMTEEIILQQKHREELELTEDLIRTKLERAETENRLLCTEQTVVLEGWLPESEENMLAARMAEFDCAWETAEPETEEYPKVPVKLKNGFFSRCMNVVTEMYSLPAYDGVDPNPLMAPFFIVFFGMMMADMAYGLLMIAAGLFVLLKTKPKESTRNFMELVFWCGISTTIWGALTGGFLGDFVPQIMKIIDPSSTFVWFWDPLFTPLDDTMMIMIGSLVLGLIQIFTGMAVSVVQKVKAGDFVDALFSEITWWVILAGVGLMALGIGNVRGIPVVLVIGAAMLVFGGTREAKGFFGKVSSLIGLIYNGVTGYFSDTLSYVRLMALMLSGSVISQVFNTLGSVFGNVVIFIIISLIGNALNLALNLLGCYVHDLRLQCLEFFNRFYKEGGKPFSPLRINTDNFNISE